MKKTVHALVVALLFGLLPGAVHCQPAASTNALVKHIKNNELTELKQLVAKRRISDIKLEEQANLVAAAIEARNQEATAVLLNAGLGVNRALPFRVNAEVVYFTPLIYAISSGADLRMVETFVLHGADVNAPSEGLFPLNFAISMGQYAVADYLLDRSATPNNTDTAAGLTPLMDLAVSWPAGADPVASALFKKLIARNVDINARSKMGASALSLAVISGKETLVRLLLDHRADPNAVNGKGETMLSLARKKGREDIAALLVQAGARR